MTRNTNREGGKAAASTKSPKTSGGSSKARCYELQVTLRCLVVAVSEEDAKMKAEDLVYLESEDPKPDLWALDARLADHTLPGNSLVLRTFKAEKVTWRMNVNESDGTILPEDALALNTK